MCCPCNPTIMEICPFLRDFRDKPLSETASWHGIESIAVSSQVRPRSLFTEYWGSPSDSPSAMCSGDGPLNDVSFSACIHEQCDRQSIGRSGSNSCAPSFLCPDPWHHDGGNGTGIVCPRAMPLIQFGCIFMADSSSIGLVDRRSLVMKPTLLFFNTAKR